MGGFTIGRYHLEWDGTQLLLDEYGMQLSTTSHQAVPIRPTREQWIDFEEGLERIGAYDWDRNYSDFRVLDGSYIELWITFKRRIRCSCHHLESPTFDMFLDLVSDLTANQH